MRIALLLIITATSLAAQEYQETNALRLFGGASFNSHSGNPNTAAPIIDCGDFSSGSGTGAVFGVGFDVPLSRSLGLGIDVLFADRSATFTRVNTYPMRDATTGSEISLTTDMSVATKLQYIDFVPTIMIPLIGTIDHRTLGVSVGPRLSLPIAKSYVQSESVVSPENGFIIVDGSPVQERVISEGQLLSPTSFLFGLTASAESFIPISQRVAVVPRIAADFCFSQVVTDADWKFFAVRADVALRFSFGRVLEAAPPPEPTLVVIPPPIPDAKPALSLRMSGFTGEVVTGNELRAFTPVVTAVFFDSASSALPVSYRRSNDGSTIDPDPVRAHDWILVRAARVVRENSNATILLEGATSGPQTEQEGLPLAQRRAEAVRQTLIQLGVPERAIETTASVLPRIASNSEFVGGRQENRRVNIIVRNAPLQKWVSAEEFATVRGALNVQAQYSGGSANARPTSMALSVNGADTTLSLSQQPTAVSIAVPVGLADTATRLLIMATAGGAVYQSDTVIDVRRLPRRSTSLETSNFSAVLRFDYNSADLTENVQALLTQLTEIIPEGSTIVIEGSSDVLGSEERNKVLSENRAANTEKFIKRVSAKKFDFRTSTRATKFSDETPQGRFLNRSIYVRVITP